MTPIKELNDQLLARIANWQPAVTGWPEDCDEDALAYYQSLMQSIEDLAGFSVRRSNDWEYGSTSFDLGLYRRTANRPDNGDQYWDLAVSCCRFAPIAIFSGRPSSQGDHQLSQVYHVPDPSWAATATSIRSLMNQHDVYMPTIEELLRPISFDLPESFIRNANCGQSINYHILFNDFY